MTNNKSRVFLVARKRGLTADIARKICTAFGMAPTLAQKPQEERWSTTDEGSWYAWHPDDPRDCDSATADKAVAYIMKHADKLRHGVWPEGWDSV